MRRPTCYLCVFCLIIGMSVEANMSLTKSFIERRQRKCAQMYVEGAFKYARQQADIRRTEEQEYLRSHSLSVFELSPEQRMLAPASEFSQQQHRIQEQFEDATNYLIEKCKISRNQNTSQVLGSTLAENQPVVKDCKAKMLVTCDRSYKYRTANGSCNNLENPTWGMASTSYAAMIEKDYGDGISSPRSGKGNSKLPSARLLSTTVHPERNVPAQSTTLAFMAFGQFVAHDIGLLVIPAAGQYNNESVNCCPNTKVKQHPQCFSIDIPANDSFFSKLGKKCMDFQRAAAQSLDCKLGSPRYQTNQQTSPLDASVIYGAYDEDMAHVRSFKGGKLAHQDSEHGPLLPSVPPPVAEVDQCSRGLDNVKCFASGDLRVNSQPSLTAFHTAFFRVHNMVAGSLSAAYLHQSDEILFQETRRIMGAAMQHILICEFLPLLLDTSWLTKHKLDICNDKRTEYDPKVDLTITNEFATGSFRLGHSLVQNDFPQVEPSGTRHDDLPLRDNFFNPMFVYQGHLDYVLMGLQEKQSQDFDRFFESALTNHLFQVRGGKYGADLVAVGIQRGRDMGLPSYAKHVEHCTGQRINCFDDLVKMGLMKKETINLLKSVYQDVRDVDIYPGGFSELRTSVSSLLTPTFSCIVSEQFRRLVYGDRHFFKHKGLSVSFTEGQLKQVSKMSLAWIFCQATEIKSISPKIMMKTDENNPKMNCKDFENPDFSKWLD